MNFVASKYSGEQDARYGGKLCWPGMYGLPFRGDNVPVLTDYDLANLTVVGDARQKIFNLSDEEDTKYYQWVRDRAANGLFSVTHEEFHWDDTKKAMYIYLEWIQYYVTYQAPQNGQINPRHFTLRG